MQTIYVTLERNWIQTYDKDLLTEFSDMDRYEFLELVIEIEKTVAEFKKKRNDKLRNL